MKQTQPLYLGALLLLAALLLLPMTMSAGAQDKPKTSYAASAECAAVIEATTGRILYEKHSDKSRPPASTTKICTAITVLEHCDDPERVVTVPDAAVGVEGSSIYLQKGEKTRIIDLLYGLMLRSGNDCAAALALLTAGDEATFATWMNETAQKAGAVNTHFVNPHGLHHDDHYTTALDLAKITAYAFRNPIFARIVATQTYRMHRDDPQSPQILKNKNKILSAYEGGDGVKTGFTKRAGRCLVASATRGGMRVISVVLNCGPMFEACAELMDDAFAHYTMYDVAMNACARVISVPVYNGKQNSVRVQGEGSYLYPLRDGEADKLTAAYYPVDALSPCREHSEAGKFTVSLQNQLLFEGKLYTIDRANRRGYFQILRDIVDAG